MTGRTLLFIVVLMGAVAGPYVLSKQGLLGGRPPSEADAAASPTTRAHDNGWQRWFGAGTPLLNTSPVIGDPLQASRAVPPVDPQPGRSVNSRQLGGPAGISLAEVLRFDVTPEWVSQNWTRVTTHLEELDYQALRVPLVTGTEPHDVAGSLTYYFNAQNALERISIYGYTGDFEPLGTLLEQRFGMRRYAAVSVGLFLGFQQNDPVAMLWLENAATDIVARPRARYRIHLELNVPRAGAKLSDEMMAKLRRLRSAKML